MWKQATEEAVSHTEEVDGSPLKLAMGLHAQVEIGGQSNFRRAA